ncbi:hypothetical protein LEMLEM_LOCUS4103 [Lemmus lemmus]
MRCDQLPQAPDALASLFDGLYPQTVIPADPGGADPARDHNSWSSQATPV